MRVLVTGRDGQVGRSLQEIAIARPELDLVFAGRAEADLSQPGAIARLIAAHRPQVLINAAAYTAVDQAEDEPALAHRINADAAGEAAAAACEIGAFILQLSTDYVFDGEGAGRYAEDAGSNPVNVYGRSKLSGEELVRAANPRHLILRTAWVYSPFGRNFLTSIMAAAKTRSALDVVDDQFGSPTSALDLARAVFTVVDRWRSDTGSGLFGTYHLAGAGEASWFELAAEIMENCHRLGFPAAEVRPIAGKDWPARARRPRNAALDSSKFARDFDFTMPHWHRAVRETIERLASQGETSGQSAGGGAGR